MRIKISYFGHTRIFFFFFELEAIENQQTQKDTLRSFLYETESNNFWEMRLLPGKSCGHEGRKSTRCAAQTNPPPPVPSIYLPPHSLLSWAAYNLSSLSCHFSTHSLFLVKMLYAPKFSPTLWVTRTGFLLCVCTLHIHVNKICLFSLINVSFMCKASAGPPRKAGRVEGKVFCSCPYRCRMTQRKIRQGRWVSVWRRKIVI